MRTQLKPVRFNKKDISRVQGFRCGKEPHEAVLADWIKTQSIHQLDNGTKIWLYEIGDGQLVGYGSLNKAPWTIIEDGVDKKTKVLSIPALAVHEDYWHKPDGADREDRFSYQLVRHLQDEAMVWLKNSPVIHPTLVLYVHPKQLAGAKLYSNCGFADFPLTLFEKVTGANLQCMTMRLGIA